MTKENILTLNVPPSLEEAVVDCLLTFESEQGFTSYAVNSHHHINEGLSVAEQVSGRQKKIRFQMYVAEENLSALLGRLKQEFAGVGVHYWVLPVLEDGYL